MLENVQGSRAYKSKALRDLYVQRGMHSVCGRGEGLGFSPMSQQLRPLQPLSRSTARRCRMLQAAVSLPSSEPHEIPAMKHWDSHAYPVHPARKQTQTRRASCQAVSATVMMPSRLHDRPHARALTGARERHKDRTAPRCSPNPVF